MKSVSIREVRQALPKLEKLLAKHGEIAITRRGKTVARLLPARATIDWAAHAALRASMPLQKVPSEVLIREDRDSR